MPLGAHKTALMGAAGGGGAPMTAFGGLISQYEDGGKTYRVHTFRGNGVFNVVDGSADVDYVLVGAGGASSGYGGGGGGGGVVTGTGLTVDADNSPYTAAVGGTGWANAAHLAGDSTFNTAMRGVTTQERAWNACPYYTNATIGSTSVRQLQFAGWGPNREGYALTQGLGSDLTAVGDLTISAWVYMDAHNTDSTPQSSILDLRGNNNTIESGAAPFIFIKNTGTGQVRSGGGYDATWDDVGFSLNTWTHILITKTLGSPSTFELWVDGSSEGTDTTSDGACNLNAGGTLGNSATNQQAAYNSGYFTGKMAEVAVWKTKLDNANIAKVYNSGNPFNLTSNSGDYDESANLVGYFAGLGNTMQAHGGGAGGPSGGTGGDGGSGGGGPGNSSGAAGAGSQGNAGGAGSSAAAGGGGGGKGGAGTAGSGTQAGNGGAGATGYGIGPSGGLSSPYTPIYAGGGGGAGTQDGTGGATGGAGDGDNDTTGRNKPVPGTGGGGGGVWNGGDYQGAGGIVIIRYEV